MGVQSKREMSMSKERWKDYCELRYGVVEKKRQYISGKAHTGGEMHFM